MKRVIKALLSFLNKYLWVFFGTVGLLSFGVLRGKNRGFLEELAERYGWLNPKKSHPTILPEVDPRELLLPVRAVEMHDPVSDDGNVSLLELLVLNSLIKKYQPKALFEIGTFDGRTALNMAANAAPHATVYTLDLPPEKTAEARKNPIGDHKFIGKTVIGRKFKDSPLGKNIMQLYGDSMTFNIEPYTNAIDFIFIDGAHSYEYVISDTKRAEKMLRESGCVAWHDYRPSCAGVAQALNELYARGGKFRNLRHVKGTALAVLLPESDIPPRQSTLI